MSKAKMPLAEAQAIAEEVKASITDVCVSAVIAGSIRRGKSEVGDIELVIVPKYKTVRIDMFSDGEENQLEKRLREMANTGIITPSLKENGVKKAWFGKDAKDESRYIAADYCGKIGIDFFVVLPDRLQWYGYILTLRTGPGDCNKLLMIGRDKGGLKPARIYANDGKVFDLEADRYLDLPKEEDVFAAWGLAYVPPIRRSVDAYWEALKR